MFLKTAKIAEKLELKSSWKRVDQIILRNAMAGSEVRVGLISVILRPCLVSARAGAFSDVWANWVLAPLTGGSPAPAPDLVTFVTRPQYSKSLDIQCFEEHNL